jgi:hypothetical protein
MFSLRMARPQQRVLTAATRCRKVEPRRIATSAKTAVSANHGEIGTVASVADHAAKDRIGMRRRQIFDAEMAGEAPFGSQLSSEGPDFDDLEISSRD